MKIYDISQSVFSCEVYKGDPVPQKQSICSMDSGDAYNLSAFSMCAHNGTHIDAPAHFISGGATVDMLPLGNTVGYAYVAFCDGEVRESEAREIISRARSLSPESAKRILIGGRATVTLPAARVFAENGILLLGNESQSVGPLDSPMDVHIELLGKGVTLLEGIRLDKVAEGVYFLVAAPLCLEGAEGAPVRAILISSE